MKPADSEVFQYYDFIMKLADKYRVLGIRTNADQPDQVTNAIAFVKVTDAVKAVESVRVHQVVVGSCTNGRLGDLETAASFLKDPKVAAGTRMLVFPATGRIYEQALAKGLVETFARAGAVVMNPGCGPCLGVHEGSLGDGEVALSTTNRNFKRRMGSRDAKAYLASPAVVAASAVAGHITGPVDLGRAVPVAAYWIVSSTLGGPT